MQSNSEVEATILLRDIEDLIDENPVTSHQIINNEATVFKLQEMRTSLRRYEKLLKKENLQQDLINQVACTLSSVKEYIKSSNDCKQKAELLQNKHSYHETCHKERSMLFVISDIQRIIAELINNFSVDLEALTDAELLQLKSDLSSKCELVNKAAQKYELILQTPFTKAEMLIDVKHIGDQYENLIQLKTDFTAKLHSLLQSRDVYKHNLFTASKLNIRLEKFSGSGDNFDYYTFKSNFNKLHERSTPKHLLTDLLKNNYLRDPAFTMVKSITDIENIWQRLQFAYGDVKHNMLSKKINQLSSIESLSRSKSPDSLVLTLSKIANLMKELVKLAEEHHIENYLYYGDALQRISTLLGDSLLSRWLAKSQHDTPPKESWNNLLQFIEKEQQLQQQKIILLGSTHNSTPKSPRTLDQPKTNKDHKHHGFNTFSFPICSICQSADGVSDHVSTSGPSGSRIIQYYTCKKFADVTPANRLSLLKEKGYCYQCLYPGAEASSGKHKEGRCQHDFVCQHDSHGRYTIRKHVLVCDEHKDNQANKDLLDKYKQRCIRSSNLPLFARNIKLSFVNRCYKSSVNSGEDNALHHSVFLLQTIVINNQQYTIFFDNGCSDFIVNTLQ